MGLGSSYNATGPARTSRIHYMLHVLDVLRLCANEEHAGRIVAHATTNPSDLDAATGLCAGHFTTGRLARTCFLRTERGGVRQIVNSCEMAGDERHVNGWPDGVRRSAREGRGTAREWGGQGGDWLVRAEVTSWATSPELKSAPRLLFYVKTSSMRERETELLRDQPSIRGEMLT